MKTWDEAYDAATWEERRWITRFNGKKHGLRGDRNICPTCLEFFNSSFAFDSHRRGEITNRKCMTKAEMIEKGFARNDDFYWVTEKQEKRER